MKTLFSLRAIASLLLVVLIYSCNHSDVYTPMSSDVLDSLSAAQPGSYWVYNCYGLRADGSTDTILSFDSLVCLSKSSAIFKDGIAAMQIYECVKTRGYVTWDDTLYWVIQNNKLWEYKTSNDMTCWSSAPLALKPILQWRLLIDCSEPRLSVVSAFDEHDSLPSVVHMPNGSDMLSSVKTQIQASNVYTNLGNRPTIKMKASVPASLIVHKSDLSYRYHLTQFNGLNTGVESEIDSVHQTCEVQAHSSVGAIYRQKCVLHYSKFGLVGSACIGIHPREDYDRVLVRYNLVY